MFTGLETVGGSAPVCLGIALVTSMSVGNVCSDEVMKVCEKQKKCGDK
jgi:hypothetical protein